MKLSVVIPVFNEFPTINEILKKVEQSPLPNDMEREIIIVDDCSTDGTREFISNISKINYKILCHKKNMGKGAALRSGLTLCTGDIIIIQDADLEYNPEEYQKLIKPILDNKADVVYGSRSTDEINNEKRNIWNSTGNKIITSISNFLTDLDLTDVETCYKVFRKEVILGIDLKEKRFGIEIEITFKIADLVKRKSIILSEVGISYNPRSYSDGKKIGIFDAISALWCMLKYYRKSV